MICLDEIEKGQMVSAHGNCNDALDLLIAANRPTVIVVTSAMRTQVSVLSCKHMYHNECISKWVVSKLSSGQVV